MKKILLFIIVHVVIIAAMNPAYAQKTGDLKAKIQKLNDKYVEATIAGDTETLMLFYTDDIIYMPNYSKMVKGIDAVRKDDEMGNEAGLKVTSMTLETLEVYDCGDMVYEIGLFDITMTMQFFHPPHQFLHNSQPGCFCFF